MRSSAGVTGRAANPRDSGTRNRIDLDGTETDRRVYAASPTIEPYEIEWARSDLTDVEISKFVSGIAGDKSTATTTTSRNNPKRCHRTSTSSGYSSHSSPLSAGSYSCYASASGKDPSYGGLAVIYESETIPRPIWPTLVESQAEDRSADYEGIYICRICGRAYGYSPSPPPPLPPPPPLAPPSASIPSRRASAREVLFELSRTLNSVIDGDVTVAPEDILRDISRIVFLEVDSRNENEYEYIRPFWTFNDKYLSADQVRNVPSRVNQINSKFYVDPRYLYEYNSARSVPLLKNDRMTRTTTTERKRNGSETEKNSEHATKESRGISGSYVLEYLDRRHIGSDYAKLSFKLNRDSKRSQNGVTSTEPEYSAETLFQQLNYSDVGSSSEGTIASLKANDWNGRVTVGGLGEDFDFTLDVTRAERLGQAIARAKRKRQWCRFLTVLFGLVFFVLSVVVVSLSITRGRKVFGSM